MDSLEITPYLLREAYSRFSELLLSPDSKERDFQKLFSECPWILSRSLPLNLLPSDIYPMGTPGKSQPDLAFFPSDQGIQGDFRGVIELKRPQSRITKQPRKRVITLSDSATTAIGQAKRYLSDIERGCLFQTTSRCLFLGNQLYAFIIMGLSDELAGLLSSAVRQSHLDDLVPKNFRLIPYDTLLRNYSSTLPPKMMILNSVITRTYNYKIQFTARNRSERYQEVLLIARWLGANGSPDVFVEKMDDYISFDASRVKLNDEHPNIDDLLSKLLNFMMSAEIRSEIGQVYER